RLWIIRSGKPGKSAAMTRGVQIRPCFEAGITGIHRNGVELPLQFPGLGIERLQETGSIEIIAGSDEQMIPDNDRCHRREILFFEGSKRNVPAFLSRLCLERNEIVVRCFEEEIVMPYRHAAVRNVCTATRLPVVMPKLPSIARVESPD